MSRSDDSPEGKITMDIRYAIVHEKGPPVCMGGNDRVRVRLSGMWLQVVSVPCQMPFSDAALTRSRVLDPVVGRGHAYGRLDGRSREGRVDGPES